MLRIFERCRPLALRQILKQFRCPDGMGAALAGAHDTAHDLSIQQKIIGARGELNQAVGHERALSRLGQGSLTDVCVARRCYQATEGRRRFQRSDRGSRSTAAWRLVNLCWPAFRGDPNGKSLSSAT